MTKVLYIAGLGHSGSTILDMSLGCHPSMVGMGELSAILDLDRQQLERKIPKLTCSCRQDVSGCPFWSVAMQAILENGDADYGTKYGALLKAFRSAYGEGQVLVDSSKMLGPLMAIKAVADVRAIYLIRDVRGWVYSRHTMLDRSMLKLAYSWLVNNGRMKSALSKEGLTYFQMGYEEFAIYPEMILEKICRFVDVQFDPAMLYPDQSGSHVISGNIARHDKDKRRRIAYDNRWFLSEKLSQLSPLIYPALRFNARNTYTNIVTGEEVSMRSRSNKRHPQFLLWSSEGKKKVIREKDERHERVRSEPTA